MGRLLIARSAFPLVAGAFGDGWDGPQEQSPYKSQLGSPGYQSGFLEGVVPMDSAALAVLRAASRGRVGEEQGVWKPKFDMHRKQFVRLGRQCYTTSSTIYL